MSTLLSSRIFAFLFGLTGIFLFIQSAQAAVYPQASTDRAKVQLNGSWKFIKSSTLTGAEATGYNDSSWSSVTVPHTWNGVTELQNDNSFSDASNSWYRTHFTIPAGDAGKNIDMYFEGVFQVADVYVNGQHLGQHRGGYTRFTFNASNTINFGGDNVLAVMVSNKDCSDCLPDGNTRLFKGYGGIYRKAWIVKTNKYHVSTTDYASSGVYITPSKVGSTSADVSIRTLVTNKDSVSKTFTVKNYLTDASENILLSPSQDVVVAAGATATVTQTGSIANPKLWSPSSPYLYNVHADVWVDGAIRDSVHEHTGFRYYNLTSSDFTLNGQSTRLRGVGKHQETEYHASAVTDAELTQDWDNLQDLGVNFVRLVHYPHADLEHTLADQRGIMVWAENGHTNSGSPTANGDNINREMVYQNYNHPSIIFWSAGNEAGGGTTATSEYASVLQAADGTRPVVYGSSGQNPSNVDYIFRNTYAGWYGGSMYDFVTSGNHWISETGAGMVTSTHTGDSFGTSHTVNSYEPEEYGQLVNEVRFNDLFNNPTHVPAYAHWVFRELSDNKYKGYRNTKGLVTFSNYKKDAFYHFKSFLKSSSVIHIVGPDYFLRDANAKGQGDIKVYANASNLSLTVNGASKGSKSNNGYTHPNGTVIGNVFYWTNVLSLGKNVIVASDGNGHSDTMTVYYKGTGSTMPAESGAAVTNLRSSNGSAYFVNTSVADQHPFYYDFDSTGDNTFDVIPSAVSGASWITTKRQSDSTKTTNLSFSLARNTDIYLMFTKQGSVPSWIASAGFTNTGASGKWRDNNLILVDYQLYKVSCNSGDSVNLGSSAIDYVVLVKPGSGGNCTSTSTPPSAISNLSVTDTANASSWSIATNLQVGDTQYGDRTYTLSTIPSSLAGADWIRTANSSKTFTGDPTVTFTLTRTADVYVAVDNRVSALSWMSGWTNTGLTIKNTEATPSTFTLFKKSFAAGSVSLGPSNAQNASMYTIIVK